MLDHLAAATHPHHATATADRLAILDSPSVARYRVFLAQIYCFEAPIEAALVATDGLPRDFVRSHLKTNKLADDLDALGLTVRDTIPKDMVRFASVGEALGWLWVLHRNTLVHGLLYRQLASKLRDHMRLAGAYLSVYEGRAGLLLRQLGYALDATANRTTIAEQIVTAANEAFRMQRQWYSCDVIGPRRRITRPVVPGQAA